MTRSGMRYVPCTKTRRRGRMTAYPEVIQQWSALDCFRLADNTLAISGMYYSNAECGPKVDSAVSKQI
jgi:hypothetical protein